MRVCEGSGGGGREEDVEGMRSVWKGVVEVKRKGQEGVVEGSKGS